ncbi:MAG: 50S ribosomal protein L5 [Candidatus Yanofskybacteria bacterium RIFCSPHIGHO2_02_FULL_41_29]|uniref:Large ribosomal subunit protein uL5 n=1 Tax=Candidatus Yanofskybacteria bacterium RIFCSPHIGHO2_01_FULL_41_53 TaxID=1802663 RepID=A0A1F8EJ18_9BACT|nr:MAG: 50S ribosomal protein L5 [Candidatus Yanofskybacteria bacterium RIFCSPHIGHO2_01_FULL_41_53]OGN11590.1 MAG: 50S ribosomal protein L5 [Candidatus Yanofskybacteria bacterium RIFCSPHIGHO2_02_FULL_41_29]OGN22827.1 MAG: 50S ribosomal protein L5 [Candidatus Yanofskybacteria bacterium RIFCSPLOWO2_01_FULL_41_67]OGN30094.1 MAG: 50S ribosomal protein L5 [Candidatus Yanofskybacteria bacterium RIFCSPLOWO2_02_FULL_41_13]OGN35142.1 MAG: 50S ribosomal protein L5 [Candidatus Yanofskybacteria bacterium R
MSNLLNKYRKEVAPAMQKKFGIDNIMAVPKIEKVVINVGIGKVAKDDKFIEKVQKDLALLSGQKPVFRKAKKSIAGFKSRQGMNIGLVVTLHGKMMYDFIDRLIHVALPRSKDFRGINPKNFDNNGNLNLGIKEHSIFPEIHYESLKDIFGLEVTVVTTAKKNREWGVELLRLMGFPVKKDK